MIPHHYRKPTPRLGHFHCAICKTQFTRRVPTGATADHCDYPALFLGYGSEGAAKAMQLRRMRIKPDVTLIRIVKGG